MTTRLEDRMRNALQVAMRERDAAAVRALRSALAAVANAEAVEAVRPNAASQGSEHIAGAHAGVGAADVARRELDEEQVRAVVRAEIDERAAAAAALERTDAVEHVAGLRHEAAVLERMLDP